MPNSLIAICTSNYPTGGLSEIQDSSTNDGSESEVESDFDDRPVQKKRKVDDSQPSRQGESSPIGKTNGQT